MAAWAALHVCDDSRALELHHRKILANRMVVFLSIDHAVQDRHGDARRWSDGTGIVGRPARQAASGEEQEARCLVDELFTRAGLDLWRLCATDKLEPWASTHLTGLSVHLPGDRNRF